ncbi:hypothetical protein G9A89_013897 [Geosiphon pyriformis]|nr:hypothetical protein G9A89_013897 [Geosiphon pyriformis]
MNGPSIKKRLTRVSTTGSVGGGSGHKIKKPPGGAKLSSDDTTLESSKSGHVVGQFNNMDTNGEASESEKIPDSKINMLQAKCFNNGATVGSPLSSINYDMNDEKEVSLPSHLSFSLEKVWVDPKIVKSQVEVAMKKLFTLDINLSAVEGKSATAKTQKAASLARENNIIVNSDLKKQGICSDRAVVIKKILMDTLKEIIVAAVSEFGQVVSIRVQLIGLWQKAVVEFAESSQTDQLAAKWSFLIGKDSVRVVKAVGDCETWASRDWYKALLFTLPVGTMAYDLGDLLSEAGEKTCVINQSLDTGNRVCCAVVCFENDEILESAFCTEPIFGGVKLFWTRLDLVWCKRYEKLGHSVLECDAEISASTKLSKSFKRVVSNENHLQLAKLYTKKGVPISRLAVFSGKSWAQVVFLVSLSDGSHPSSGSGFGSSFGASGVVGHSSPVVSVNSYLETRFAFLERSLELLTNKVSGIVNKLDNLNLVPMALTFSSQPSVILVMANVEFGSDMVLDDPKPVALPSFSVSSGVSNLGSSSLKILTSKVGCLKSKLMALEALICSVLKKLDQVCAGSGSANDIVRWHVNSGNDISIIMETKFPDVHIFTSGLDASSSGASMAVIMNSSVIQHVLKIDKISGQLISIQLLFKGKLLVTILGIYAGASASVCFGQAFAVNSMITSTINSSSFVILSGDFNELDTKKSTSLRKCVDLGLVNSFKGHSLASSPMWSNSRGVKKVIDYIFVSENLVFALMKWDIGMVLEFFNTDHKMISVSIGLGGLFDA